MSQMECVFYVKQLMPHSSDVGQGVLTFVKPLTKGRVYETHGVFPLWSSLPSEKKYAIPSDGSGLGRQSIIEEPRR